MKIEIKGAGFINKGAELMVHAINEQIRKKYPEARFVFPVNNSCPYEKRVAFGAYQKILFKRYGVDAGYFIQALLPKLLKRHLGIVDNDEIDVVLDASGFAYIDQWGSADTVTTAKSYKGLKRKKNVKIILLPQAFGPFTSEEIKKAFQQIVENSDLIFPRDDISYQYVTNLVGEQDNIVQFPDFTNLLEGVVDKQLCLGDKICIIPNFRMIDKISTDRGCGYIPFIASFVNELLSAGEQPFCLIHEGEKDLWLAKEINKCCNEPIDIIQEADPLVIKGLIGECKAVIGSRFHGLVSSLSQGVPTLAVGWSHKYDMLFKDYGFSEGCLRLDMSQDEKKKIVDSFIDRGKLKALRGTLSTASRVQKQFTEEMWESVFACIDA
jgi:polysaccharide pyruvyl transferase WcaK-like protein